GGGVRSFHRILVIGLLALCVAPAAAFAAHPPAAAHTARAARRHAASAAALHPAASSDAPFWTGHPDAAAFGRIQDQRLARARAAIARLVAVKGRRTTANTLRPYDDALLQLDAVLSQASLMSEVHPDSNLRMAAERAT